MIFGTCEVSGNKVVTSKTTYVITHETRPDVRRVFLMPSLILTGGFTLFGLGFFDLLYAYELALIVAIIVAALLVGFTLARLVILDRVTRGMEQMSAVYGLHATLQARREQINQLIDRLEADAL